MAKKDGYTKLAMEMDDYGSTADGDKTIAVAPTPEDCDHDHEHDSDDDEKENTPIAKIAVSASWIVNWLLLIVKFFLFVETGSRSILAALADSVVDLLSQFVLWLAERHQDIHHTDYPVGRSRLEALSVLACGVIMAFANIEVIQYSITTLVEGAVYGNIPTFDTHWYTYALMGLGIFLKAILWRYCTWVQTTLDLSSDMLDALAEDHLNDVLSNAMAVTTLAIAAEVNHDPNLWWVDAAGAIFIGAVIVYRWWEVGTEQVEKIVGKSAPQEFIDEVEGIATGHDPRVLVDCTRVYYCGARYHVEMEIVLPAQMVLTETHDLALLIQHKIEALPEVERSFVHVDHAVRDGLEHKVERLLTLKVTESEDEEKPDSPKPWYRPW